MFVTDVAISGLRAEWQLATEHVLRGNDRSAADTRTLVDHTSAQTTADRQVLIELLARVAVREKCALGLVYQLTSGKLNALLMRMLGDQSTAEEVLQEVFLTVWNRSASFDPSRASPITWLVTIARNKAIDRLRAQRARGASPVPIDEAKLTDPSPSTVERLEQAQLRRQLLVCLDQLDASQQSAIRAAFFEGLTYEAIAMRERVPVGTMRSWIRRGLLRLRGCLES